MAPVDNIIGSEKILPAALYPKATKKQDGIEGKMWLVFYCGKWRILRRLKLIFNSLLS
jgi:hypothetical protein